MPEKEKGELELAIEALTSRGIKTVGYEFRFETVDLFDQASQGWIKQRYLVKEKDSSEVRYPMIGGESND